MTHTIRAKRQKGDDRFMDAISFRISRAQRAFLEQVADEKNIGLCEAARSILNKVMAKGGQKYEEK